MDGARLRTQLRSHAARASGLLALTLAVASPALPDEVTDLLAERIQAAPLIVEGEAGRGYASWDGTDPGSISTFTPLTVARVLKGVLAEDHILLRQPGGSVGGASRMEPLAAQFEPEEHVIVFLGPRDPGDGSFDIDGGALGAYRVTTDAGGVPAVTVRLGVDAATYSSREKAPGTLLGLVTVETFAQLAADSPPGQPKSNSDQVAAAVRTPARHHPLQPRRPPAAHRGRDGYTLIVLASLFTLGAIGWRLMRRRDTR